MEECYCCKKKADKLYEHKGWKVCWDCYFAAVDKEEGIDANYEQALADKQAEYMNEWNKWMNAPLGTPEPDEFQEPEEVPKAVKTDLF